MSNAIEEPRVVKRRCKSVTRAEEIQHHAAALRRAQLDKPCHKPRDSLFSWSSGFTDFTGFVNWGFLLLSMGGLRLFLENLIKYGVRVDPTQWLLALSGGHSAQPAILLVLYSCVPVSISLMLERSLASESIAHGLGMCAHVLNLILLVLLPMAVINVYPEGFSLLGATSVCFVYSILFLKLWSYIQVNMWCRTRQETRTHLRRQSLSISQLGKLKNGTLKGDGFSQELVYYPDNLTMKDISYFLLVPTLCYELNFPRTSRIRKRFVVKRAVEVLVGFQVIVALFQQWIIPSVKNSLIPFSNMDMVKATERLLKLAIPNHLVWLMLFYLVFHSFFNLIGELLHFADRNFYNDWWNANNIETFWRSWNMPVHRWAVRHLYIPVVELGYSKTSAMLSVFFISAFFHEYLVSVPLRTFKHWAFLGMMWQVPMSYLSRIMETRFGPRCGNCIVWAGLILGQPLCIMMYYHDYIITHFGTALIESYAQI